VRRSLSWISPLDLDGVAFIKLMDEIEEPHAEAPGWHKQAKAEGTCINGMYLPSEGKSPAHITLYGRDLYRGIPRIYSWTTVPTLSICYTLAHEVGHHLMLPGVISFSLRKNSSMTLTARIFVIAMLST